MAAGSVPDNPRRDEVAGGVAAPLRIDVLTTEDGRDRALRVVADDSQTVLRFL